MDSQVVLSVRFAGSCKLLTVSKGSCFNQVIEQIISMWPQLSPDKLHCVCKIGSVCDVIVNSQSDLENMLLLCEYSTVNVVFVELSLVVHTLDDAVQITKGIGGGVRLDRDCVQHILIQDSCLSLDLGQAVDVDDSLQFDEIIPEISKTQNYPLLSDGWSDILNGGVGVRFSGGADEFRIAVIKNSFKLGFNFNYIRNTNKRIVVVCREAAKSGCEWNIKAKIDPATQAFILYQSNLEHSCIRSLIRGPSVERMCPRLIGTLMTPNVKRNPHLKAKDVIDAMKIGYGVELPYWKARRAAEVAKDNLYGTFAESYGQLQWYCQAVKVTNPGSVVVFEANEVTNAFERAFIAFNGCIQGFLACPPMLFIDGTFLKYRSQGTLLVAVAKDGHNGLFPVAFALVSAETKSNWTWFLTLIRDNFTHEQQICYLSDRNKGLLSALPLVYKDPIHFYCMYHLLQNLKGKFASGWSKNNRIHLGEFFKECAYAPNKLVFEQKIEQFITVGGIKAKKWLAKLPYEKWALAFSPNTTRYGEMTSNAAESFNSWLGIARSKPVTQMFDYIRTGISSWVMKRRRSSSKWSGVLVPKKELIWNQMTSVGRSWTVLPCPGGDYEVLSTPSVRVDLEARVCGCYIWQSTGFPCCHAVAVIIHVNARGLSDVAEYFFSSKYRECYSWDINPVTETVMIECQGQCKSKVIGPPVLGRPAGRPIIQKRIPSYGEFPKKKKKPDELCTRCGINSSHNSFTCGMSKIVGNDSAMEKNTNK